MTPDESADVRIARLEEKLKAADKALTVATDLHRFMLPLLINTLLSVSAVAISIFVLFAKKG
jgi:hypothetical protein